MLRAFLELDQQRKYRYRFMKIQNVKQWKTTALGLILIIASVASVFVKGLSWSDASFGIGIGLVLIFSPDLILSRFEKFVK